MGSFFTKLRTATLGYSHELIDRVVDMNSIPVLKQDIRDLEDALSTTQHSAAVAAASITTLTRQRADVLEHIEADKATAKRFLDLNDQENARKAAGRIHDNQQQLTAFDAQIKATTEQSKMLDDAVEKLQTRHQKSVTQLRTLQLQERSASSLEKATKSMKQAASLTATGSGADVDSISERIQARQDVAREEFNRTIGSMDSPDPVKDAAVDDILADLKSGK